MLDQIGQMIITGLEGTALSSQESRFLKDENIGGVILFEKNYESPSQLANLVNSIQKLRNDYPFFIAVDHEGGRIIRFKKDFTQFPAMLDVAKIDSPKLCFQVAKIMALELTACGINLNMAPCCDILTNKECQVIGDRTFGESGEEVAKFISPIIRGFQTVGIASCAKHFPGHGLTSEDSHFTLPVVKTTLVTLRNREFIPFVKAVRYRVDMIMMAHLLVPSIDSKLPCTLSPKAYSLLRSEFKYNRIIISDDMQMGAIKKHYPLKEAAVMAVEAGADIIEYRDLCEAQTALDALKNAVVKKEIKNRPLKMALERIHVCKKANMGQYKPVDIQGIEKKLETAASKSLLEDIKKKIAS